MSQIAQRSLQLFGGPLHTCNYLPDQQSRSWFVDPSARLTPTIYAHLLANGYRRSGNIVYRPACPECRECVPVRVPVASFQARRWARRNLRSNRDLQMSIHRSGINAESLDLYQRYQRVRHTDGEMDYDSCEELERFFYCDWLDTLTLEWRLDSRLMAVAIVDEVPHALSAVYTFFDPEFSDRGLGTHAVLRQLELAARYHLPLLYLGYWIEGCDKMRYKRRFRPIEAFDGENWRLLQR